MIRCLDIGPGNFPIEGFETLDVSPGPGVTHVGRAETPPFSDGVFDIVHASHVLEHVQWYELENTVAQWARILKSGGILEVWTVNAHALMKVLVEFEETGNWTGPSIGTWKQDLTKYDPYKWAVGRMMNYPKKGSDGTFWMHRALITPNYLKRVMTECGLQDVESMSKERIRGKDHGWINFGVCGVKP